MNFVLANYELLNGLSQGLKTVCNLMILHKKQIRKSKNVRYLFTITIISIDFLKSPKKLVRFKTPSNDLSSTICYEYTFVECLQVNGTSKRNIKSPVFDLSFSCYLSFSVKERQDLHTPSRQTNEQPLTTSEHTFEFAYTDFLCHLEVNRLSFLTYDQ